MENIVKHSRYQSYDLKGKGEFMLQYCISKTGSFGIKFNFTQVYRSMIRLSFITAFGILPRIVGAEPTIPPAAVLMSEGIIIEKFVGDKNFLLTKDGGAHYLISYQGKLYTCLYFGRVISCWEVEEEHLE